MKSPYLERSSETRGELYNNHNRYFPTQYEQEAEYWLMHHSDGGITEVLHTSPNIPKSDFILVMVPGFITVLDSWEIFLQEMKDEIEIYYWESREKGTFHPPSSKLKRSHFSKNRFQQDLKEVIEAIGVPQNRIILAGSSFGGTHIIDILANHLVNPYAAILIGANIHFHLPFPGNFLIRLIPASLIKWFKPAIRWYLRNFEVDMESDEAQYRKYVKAIELANFKYIKHTVINYHRHPQEHLLSNISVPTIVVGARKDQMHTIDESKFTVKELQHGELAEFETNKETHSQPFAKYFRQKFFELQH